MCLLNINLECLLNGVMVFHNSHPFYDPSGTQTEFQNKSDMC